MAGRRYYGPLTPLYPNSAFKAESFRERFADLLSWSLVSDEQPTEVISIERIVGLRDN